MPLCVVTHGEFKKISKCTIAKAIWDKLKVMYESTNQVKETRISMLVYEYENFKMEKGKIVEQIFERLAMIVNDLHI